MYTASKKRKIPKYRNQNQNYLELSSTSARSENYYLQGILYEVNLLTKLLLDRDMYNDFKPIVMLILLKENYTLNHSWLLSLLSKW